MGEDVARALGAGGTGRTIAGKPCTPRPLSIKELSELQRECLREYRRAYLQAHHDSLEFMPEGERGGLMARKSEEAARWDVGDLPVKWAYDPRRIDESKALAARAAELLGLDEEPSGMRLRVIVAALLDQESMSPEEYEGLAGRKPPRIKVPYDRWWISGCWEGRVAFLAKCFAADGLTRGDIERGLAEDPSGLIEAAQEVEHLTSLQLGNRAGST